MKATTKKKLCWNCEGSVAVTQENCPYCSVYLSPASTEDSKEEEEDPLAPPYQMKDSKESLKVPASPYTFKNTKSHSDKEPEAGAEIGISEGIASSMQNVALPLVLLLSGSVFLLFGFILLLFSHNGLLTLQWSGDYWFIWLLIAIPMLFFGGKALQQLQD